MTLTARVSRFFLIALACMLCGYSIVLYGLARYTFYREFDQHLQSALHTLVAAIEVEVDDVKWEPSDHNVTIGREGDPDDVRWVVVDEQGLVVDHSANLQQTPEKDVILRIATQHLTDSTEASVVQDWRFLQSHLKAITPKPASERDPLEREELTVTAALSTSPIRTRLNQLATLALVLPLIVWLLAAIGGRWFCRRALEPVGQMASTAASIGPRNPHQRLPVATSGDELAELAVTFNRLLDQLFQAYEQQQRFAGDAAHQLRTPLTILQGQIEVALRRPRSASDYVQTLDVLNEQVIELRQMVEALLFLARPENEAEPPSQERIDLAIWLPQYLAKWSTHPRSADLTLRASVSATLHLSTVLLGQLLDNLITNAFKYSAPATPVELQTERHGEQVDIHVIDRGMGIATADQTAIFEPFYRTAEARRSGAAGTGLGLALASRLAAALNGTLRCHSVPQVGSRFTLSVPVDREVRLQPPLERPVAITDPMDHAR